MLDRRGSDSSIAVLLMLTHQFFPSALYEAIAKDTLGLRALLPPLSPLSKGAGLNASMGPLTHGKFHDQLQHMDLQYEKSKKIVHFAHVLDEWLQDHTRDFHPWTRTPIPAYYTKLIDSIVNYEFGAPDLSVLLQMDTMSQPVKLLLKQRYFEIYFLHPETEMYLDTVVFDAAVPVSMRGFDSIENTILLQSAQQASNILRKVTIMDRSILLQAIERYFPPGSLDIVLTHLQRLCKVESINFWKTRHEGVHGSNLFSWRESTVPSIFGEAYLKHVGILVHSESDFFTGENLGYSQGCAVIHELSHYIFDTQDLAYGRQECHDLLEQNPHMTLHNADSYSWFLHDLLE